MIAEKQKSSNIGVGLGFVVEIVGRVLTAQGGAAQNTGLAVLGIGLIVVGAVLFIWGCVNYCQGKGYSGWLGLLGLLSCLGLVILVLLPDKYKGGGPPTVGGGPGVSQPGVWPPPPSGPTS